MSYSNASTASDQVLLQQLNTADTGHERHCIPALRPQKQQISSDSKAANLRRSAAVAGLRRCSDRNGYWPVGMSRTHGVDTPDLATPMGGRRNCAGGGTIQPSEVGSHQQTSV